MHCTVWAPAKIRGILPHLLDLAIDSVLLLMHIQPPLARVCRTATIYHQYYYKMRLPSHYPLMIK